MLEPIYIVGPTAVGKSDVAAELAGIIGGEVVGADAFQVYQGLDLLTAKPSDSVRRGVPHHFIGEIPLTQIFDVGQYREAASGRVLEISGRGRVPVVVGGTGLYVRSLTHGLAPLPPADASLRADLEAEPLPTLQQRLRELDPTCASEIDLQNPRRVIRALEVCLIAGLPYSSFREQSVPVRPIRGVLLNLDREVLRRRIERRTRQMFQSGVIEEVSRVGEISRTAEQAIGFLDIRALLAGEISEPECQRRITLRTQQYAKRQLTWFRRSVDWRVLDLADEDPPSLTVSRIIEVLRLAA